MVINNNKYIINLNNKLIIVIIIYNKQIQVLNNKLIILINSVFFVIL